MEVPSSVEKATRIRRLDTNIYTADLSPSFCVGTVPNGGYVAAVFLRVASEHLASRNQPHTISAQWSYLNRTMSGRALLRVHDAKIGRGTSVLHITIHQHGILEEQPWIAADSPAEVAAYITNGNLDAEAGVSLPTGWTLDHQPPPANLSKLPFGEDPKWELMYMPLMERVPMLNHLEYYRRRSGHILPTTLDFWVRFANGERFSQTSLGFVADAGPPLLVESYRPTRQDAPVPEGGFSYNKLFWFPTLTMSLDVRRKSGEAWKWLRLRVVGKEIKNGRYDAEVLMFDEQGNLVALSNHVAMAIDVERNYAKRENKGKI